MRLIAQFGLLAIFLIFAYFIVFSIGLAQVFREAKVPVWRAFCPVFNFMFLVDLTGLPRKFFWYSLLPYVGAIYAFGVMNRLAQAYGKSILFTSVWLTFASAVGIHVLQRGTTLDKTPFSEPAPDIESIKASLKKLSKKKK